MLHRLLAAAIAVAHCAHPAPAQSSYVYAGVERALPLDATRVAVRAPDLDAGGIERALAPLGVERGGIARWPIAGWWVVGVPSAARTSAGVDALVDAIARDPRVEFATPVYVGDDGGPLFPTRDLLIGYADETTAARHADDFARRGEHVERGFGGLARVDRVRTSERDGRRVLAAARALAFTNGVSFAEPDMIHTGRGGHVPNDPQFAACWGLHNVGQSGGTADMDMDAPEAWDRTIGDPSVIVAVIDTGVQQDHPDLHQIPGTDTTSDGPSGGGGPVNAFDRHGTPVAGCVSAVIDNGVGTVGIAPGCVSASARAFIGTSNDGSWIGQPSWTVDALQWAQSVGARVTNNSNVYGFQSSTIAAKYQQTWNAGLVHFACNGNDGTSGVAYPASIPVVNAVMALDRQGQRASFSNFGPGTDFAAPGAAIWSTDRTGNAGYSSGDHTVVNGTSFASPYAAGIAALLVGTMPGASSALIEQTMRDSCVDLGVAGYDTTFGHGFVNALRALDAGCEPTQSYCMTSPNSVGPGAAVSSTGSTSVGTDDLVLLATGCPPNSSGLWYMGTATTQTPFGNGLRCVAGSTFRLAVVVASIFGESSHALHVASLSPAAGVLPGSTRYFQLWYRNPAGGGAGFNLSDGLRVRFCW